MNVTIVRADAAAWLRDNSPEFILTDVPHPLLSQISKIVEAKRLQWINASSPQWLTLVRTGEKVLEPYARIIRAFPEFNTVCDPCMGWGTTGFAAVSEGRNFIGVDHDLERCQFVAERFHGGPDTVTTVGF